MHVEKVYFISEEQQHYHHRSSMRFNKTHQRARFITRAQLLTILWQNMLSFKINNLYIVVSIQHHELKMTLQLVGFKQIILRIKFQFVACKGLFSKYLSSRAL